MSSEINIVKNALEYYDSFLRTSKKKFKNVEYIRIIQQKGDMERNIIKMFDKDDNEIITSKFEYIGVFVDKHKSWVWAWAFPTLRKNETYIAKKILNYGLNLSENNNLLKSELITSRFVITSPIQLELHVALATYLSKTKSVFEFSKKEVIGKDYYVEQHNHNQNQVRYFLFLLDV